jgi:hypothetical protein
MSKRLLDNVERFFESVMSVKFYDLLNVPSITSCGQGGNSVNFPIIAD